MLALQGGLRSVERLGGRHLRCTAAAASSTGSLVGVRGARPPSGSVAGVRPSAGTRTAELLAALGLVASEVLLISADHLTVLLGN